MSSLFQYMPAVLKIIQPLWRQRLMEWGEQRKKKKNPAQNARTETHLSVLTPTSANRCDQFNEACALDLALLSGGGKIFFQKKHHIVRATLFTAQCLASLCLETGTPCCVWEPRHPDRWPRLPLPEWHNEHQTPVPKVGANQAMLPPAEWKKSDAATLKYQPAWGKSSSVGTKETWGQRKENTHRQNSVGNDPKSRSKSPMLRELHSHLFFFRAAWF